MSQSPLACPICRMIDPCSCFNMQCLESNMTDTCRMWAWSSAWSVQLVRSIVLCSSLLTIQKMPFARAFPLRKGPDPSFQCRSAPCEIYLSQNMITSQDPSHHYPCLHGPIDSAQTRLWSCILQPYFIPIQVPPHQRAIS